ncbi:MAG: ubiquinol-cytochrome c reductase iron-sulfur subunit [Terracidiphilus sp.]
MSEPSEKNDQREAAPSASPAADEPRGEETPETPAEWLGSAKEKASARWSASAAGSSRRAFLFKLAVAVNGLVGLALATPILGYLLGPALKKAGGYNSWIRLGAVDQFPRGETRLAEYINPVTSPSDGETAKTACWVRHTDDGRFQVFAINCAHLGCPVRWFPQSRLFLCPCHGGAYYEDGARASGPPLRGLFQYQHRVNEGNLMILAGQLPTLSTEACLGKKPLVRIEPGGGGTGRRA